MEPARVTSEYLGIEQLYVNLVQRYDGNSISFKELQGMSFIVLRDIGAWREVIQTEIPQATFIYQEEKNSLVELTRHSTLPYFTTDLSLFSPSKKLARISKRRHTLPIIDRKAQMRIYLNYRRSEKHRIKEVSKLLGSAWNVDQ